MHAWTRLCFLALTAASLAGCSATKSAPELKVIQDTRGLFSKSLYYTGSSHGYHYFEQMTLDANPILMTGLFTDYTFRGKKIDDEWKTYRVARAGVALPLGAEFERRGYSGENDARRRKVRLQEMPSAQDGYAARHRKSDAERFEEKLRELDPAKLRVQQAGEGRVQLVYAGSP